MTISRTYTINGFNITVSAQGSVGNPANVLAISATASYTPPSASSVAPATSLIAASDQLTLDPTQAANQTLSVSQMQVQVEAFLQALANRLATIIALYNTFQQVT